MNDRLFHRGRAAWMVERVRARFIHTYIHIHVYSYCVGVRACTDRAVEFGFALQAVDFNMLAAVWPRHRVSILYIVTSSYIVTHDV